MLNYNSWIHIMLNNITDGLLDVTASRHVQILSECGKNKVYITEIYYSSRSKKK